MDTNIPEIWKPIPGYERYEVSNKGQVWDNERIKLVHPITPKNSRHYIDCRVKIPIFKSGRATIHRLVIWAFTGSLSTPGRQVNHKDGNKLNNNLSNLELVSVAENIRHARITGLNPGKRRTIIKT